jgi:citrate lyase subunit beta/citryl-CoA lyase
MTARPRRSVLYMPGSNARALDKAKSIPADALILDLEDSVAPDAKEAARAQVAAAVAAGGYGRREIVIRINSLDSPWGRADLEAAAAAGPDAVLVPKVASADTIREVSSLLDRAGAPAGMGVWAMMETPMAVIEAGAIAAARRDPAGRRFAAMVLGTNDLAKETRARMLPGRQPMLAWLSLILAAARAHGLDVIDGVFNDLDDEAGFEAECRQGLDLGMDGKTLIHPKQVAIANAVFSPSEAELAQARRILAAFAEPANAGRGVITLDGRMVERLHAEMAERTVAIARMIDPAA